MSIAFSSVPVLAATIAAARRVDLASYTLRDGPIREALVVAARGGAAVRVRLERDPLDDAAGSLHRENADSVRVLTAAGADAALSGYAAPVLHLKAAVVDGVAWLDDRNWAGDGRETVVRDSESADVATVGAALAGGPDGAGSVRTTKAGAQALEVAVIRAAGAEPLAVESESFGNGPVYAALLARSRAGWPTRLLVAGREAAQPTAGGERERRELGRLAALGVEVRSGDPQGADIDEKLAVGRTSAWVGSANASYARGSAGDQRDWGLATREPLMIDALRATFERNWMAGQRVARP